MSWVLIQNGQIIGEGESREDCFEIADRANLVGRTIRRVFLNSGLRIITREEFQAEQSRSHGGSREHGLPD